MASPNTTLFQHEMPGGQFSNLRQQATAVGLGDRWPEVCRMYARVNMMFGDIIKVTPSSKVVGDMALFMVQNHLTEEDIYAKGAALDFPQSVVDSFDGKFGCSLTADSLKSCRRLFCAGKNPIWNLIRRMWTSPR